MPDDRESAWERDVRARNSKLSFRYFTRHGPDDAAQKTRNLVAADRNIERLFLSGRPDIFTFASRDGVYHREHHAFSGSMEDSSHVGLAIASLDDTKKRILISLGGFTYAGNEVFIGEKMKNKPSEDDLDQIREIARKVAKDGGARKIPGINEKIIFARIFKAETNAMKESVNVIAMMLESGIGIIDSADKGVSLPDTVRPFKGVWDFYDQPPIEDIRPITTDEVFAL